MVKLTRVRIQVTLTFDQPLTPLGTVEALRLISEIAMRRLLTIDFTTKKEQGLTVHFEVLIESHYLFRKLISQLPIPPCTVVVLM